MHVIGNVGSGAFVQPELIPEVVAGFGRLLRRGLRLGEEEGEDDGLGIIELEVDFIRHQPGARDRAARSAAECHLCLIAVEIVDVAARGRVSDVEMREAPVGAIPAEYHPDVMGRPLDLLGRHDEAGVFVVPVVGAVPVARKRADDVFH